MFIPTLEQAVSQNTAESLEGGLFGLLTKDKGSGQISNWSSLIGIITAIGGNILISFALNTQRYAHVRLEREQQAREKATQDRGKLTPNASYGTLGGGIGEHNGGKQSTSTEGYEQRQAGANGKIWHTDDEDEEDIDYDESDHLLSTPQVRNGQNGTDDSDYSESDTERESYLKSPYWWLGIVLMVVGEAGNFLAYGFAPASIVSPLGVVAIISNCLIAPIMLKENFRMRDFIGVIIAVAGAVTVVLSAKTSNPKLGPQQIWKLITRWEFETYLGITLIAIAILMFASNKYGHRTIAIDIGLVGLFGGYTALSTKGVASMLSYALWKAPTYPITYVLILTLVVTAIMQIKYLNRALQRFNSTQVIPTQFVVFTIFVIVGSAVLYHDFDKTGAAQAIKFVGGCALTFLGVWCITSGRDKSGEDDDEEADEDTVLDEEEDAIAMVDEEIDEHINNQNSQTTLPPSTPPSKPLRKPKTPLLQVTSPKDNYDSPASFATAPQTPYAQLRHQASQSDPDLSSPNAPAVTSRPPPTPVAAHTPSSSTIYPDSSQQPHSDSLLPTLDGSASSAQGPRSPRMPSLPSASPSAFRGSFSRHSITSGMRPSPLTAPLSSSLSALVAHTIKRGMRSRESLLSGTPPTGQSPGLASGLGGSVARRRNSTARRKARGSVDDGAAGSSAIGIGSEEVQTSVQQSPFESAESVSNGR